MSPDDVAKVRRHFEERAVRFQDPVRHLGSGREWRPLPSREGYVDLPASVLEACGFYYVNVMKRDLGGVHAFWADVDGTTVFGVLATSDGDRAHLEVYGDGGEPLGAALLDHGAGATAVRWDEVAGVRRRAGVAGFEGFR